MQLREVREQRSLAVTAMRNMLDKAEAENRDLTPDEAKEYAAMESRAAGLAERIERMARLVEMERNAPASPVESPRAAESIERRMGDIFKAVAVRSTPGASMESRAATGQYEALGSEGGFFVNSDLSFALAAKIAEKSMLLPLVSRVQISAGSSAIQLPVVDESSRADGLRHGGAVASWLGEGDKITSSKLKFKMLNVTLGKLAALYYATDELLADAPALGAIMSNFFASEFGFSIDAAILKGSGVAHQPLGVLNSPALVVAAKVSGQTASTVNYQNILAMWSRLWPRGRGNAVWLVGPGVETQLYQMTLAVGDGGAPVFLPGGGASAAPYASLFGRPVMPCEQLPELGQEGDIVLADLGQYLWVEKGGTQNAMSIHLRFEYGETAFRSIVRCNGMPTWNAPLTPYSGAETVSPFVTLEARTS